MSMQFLLDFTERDEEFRLVSRRAAEYRTVQGVFLEIDPDWLNGWRTMQHFRMRRLLDRRFLRLLGWRGGPFGIGTILRRLGPWDFPNPPTEKDIMRWRPPNWTIRHPSRSFREDLLPLIVRVRLRPIKEPDEAVPSVERLQEGINRLRVVIETTPQAFLCANPRRMCRPVVGGISIGISAGDFATLGAILKSENGESYAITCSHVAPAGSDVVQPSRHDSRKVQEVGKTVLSEQLIACLETDNCNEESATVANEIDASIVKLDPRCASACEVLEIGALNGVVKRAAISMGQSVHVMGRTSKHHLMQLGPVGSWVRLEHNGNLYCYKKVFLVASPFGKTGVIMGGDSGAPVCRPTKNGTGWCGMIIGSNIYNGYATFAQSNQEWWIRNGLRLSV
jgi:hypothetical protein